MTGSSVSGLDIGIQVFPGSPTAAIEEAQRYESLGFTSIWVADHFHGAGRDTDWVVPEVFSLLGAMAAVTSTIHLGSCVLAMAKRSPAIVAQAALTLSALSRGRFQLGVGTGFGPDLRAFGVDTTGLAARLEEAIRVIRGLFRSNPDQPFSLSGNWNRLDHAFLNVPEAKPPPILVAAMGPRMLAVTEHLADGWIPFALSPAIYAEFLSRMPSRPQHFRAALWIPTFIEAPGEDRTSEAVAVGRLYLSMAPKALEALFGSRFVTASAATSWNREAAAAFWQDIPREAALAVTLHGSADQCVEQLTDFAAAGCDMAVLRLTDAGRRQHDAERIAREVITQIRT